MPVALTSSAVAAPILLTRSGSLGDNKESHHRCQVLKIRLRNSRKEIVVAYRAKFPSIFNSAKLARANKYQYGGIISTCLVAPSPIL